ncbi:MAG: hypothetical protein NVSMB25_20780 [Thermoleophilaceae bacterium]
MEATGNALAIAIIAPHVAEVLLAHAKQVRAISHARVKTGCSTREFWRPAAGGSDPGGVGRR